MKGFSNKLIFIHSAMLPFLLMSPSDSYSNHLLFHSFSHSTVSPYYSVAQSFFISLTLERASHVSRFFSRGSSNHHHIPNNSSASKVRPKHVIWLFLRRSSSDNHSTTTSFNLSPVSIFLSFYYFNHSVIQLLLSFNHSVTLSVNRYSKIVNRSFHCLPRFGRSSHFVRLVLSSRPFLSFSSRRCGISLRSTFFCFCHSIIPHFHSFNHSIVSFIQSFYIFYH